MNKHTILRIAVAVFVLVSMIASSVASEVPPLQVVAEEVSENQRITENEIQDTIQDYAKVRESLFSCSKGGDRSSVVKVSTAVSNDSRSREEGLAEWEAQLGCTFTSVETSIRINSIDKKGCFTVVNAYEWNDVHYVYPGSSIENEMGFGSSHTITIEKNDQTITLTSDSYSEENTTGLCSSDRVCSTNETEGVFEDSLSNEDAPLLSEPIWKIYSGYNYSSAISYADTWCGVNAAGDSHSMHPTNYNPAYYYENLDCANFVSQCLHAGGVAYVNYGNYNNGWYAATPPATSVPICSPSNSGGKPWMQVSAFDTFWNSQGIGRGIVNSSYSNLFPGNPFFFLGGTGATGHLMICVGYNSAGVPVYDAHNGDAYHCPVNHSSSAALGKTLYTYFFRCPHNWVSYSSYSVCSHCGSYLNFPVY